MRFFFPAVPPVALWAGLGLVVAAAGVRAARAVRCRGSELGGVAITGLLAVLLSPVAWIHHLSWIVIALGVVIGDGRDGAGWRTAVAGGALFTAIVPLWGKRLWHAHEAPALVCRLLEDTYGLAAIRRDRDHLQAEPRAGQEAASCRPRLSLSAAPDGNVLA